MGKCQLAQIAPVISAALVNPKRAARRGARKPDQPIPSPSVEATKRTLPAVSHSPTHSRITSAVVRPASPRESRKSATVFMLGKPPRPVVQTAPYVTAQI